MIAKAKAISHGINDIRYITGESQHKKHPEKIYRVLDNLLPSEPDAMGIWNSMQLTLSQHRPIKNSVIRIELEKSVLAKPIWLIANTRFGCIRNLKAKSPISTLRFAVWMKMAISTMTTTFIFEHNVQPSEWQRNVAGRLQHKSEISTFHK